MISTHVLDLNLGSPAQGIAVRLEKQTGQNWALISESQTNADGRIVFACPAEAGTFRLDFRIESYFTKLKMTPFFTEAQVVFRIADTGRKYHVPLLLSPFGYSTYRGS